MESEEILLFIRDQEFKIRKDTLCEHSDYFRAMFSGNYVENNQHKVSIDVLNPNTMQIILQYMKIGLIDLLEYPLPTIGEIALAANYLQITELLKQVEYSLDLQISHCNWIETMTIAENSSFSKLEQLSAAYGLLSFKSMKPENIPSLHKLAWYLSHPYLDTLNELDVFNFGHEWILQHETGGDALLIILGCLDIKRLNSKDVEGMKVLIPNFETSLAAKVIDLFYEVVKNNIEINLDVLDKNKTKLCEKFTERVWTEGLKIVKQSKTRQLEYTPIIPMWTLKDSKPALVPHCLYTFKENEGFGKWIEVADMNLWGWNIISWGVTKIIVVCGEHGRGTGNFMRDVKVYDTLRQEWTRHGVKLPPRRHAGLAVIDDSLFLVGGVGGFRVVLETAGIYDLKQRSYRKIAKFPDAIQGPALCSHKNSVYAAGHKNIYVYKDSEESDNWDIVVGCDIRMSCMSSFNDYIYCIQSYFSHLYRFRPNVDQKLQLITHFVNLPAAICSLGNRLVAFTRTVCDHSYIFSLEEYKEDQKQTNVVFKESNLLMRVNDVTGSCVQVLSLPPLKFELSSYHKHYLSWYS